MGKVWLLRKEGSHGGTEKILELQHCFRKGIYLWHIADRILRDQTR